MNTQFYEDLYCFLTNQGIAVPGFICTMIAKNKHSVDGGSFTLPSDTIVLDDRNRSTLSINLNDKFIEKNDFEALQNEVNNLRCELNDAKRELFEIKNKFRSI